jgi:GrpB-like predicted nucleotidyltransferase (UPF0157 family)
MEKYVFQKYNAQYTRYFGKEKLILKKVLGKGVAIEHVGSTAVKNLGGKGIVDIAIGIKWSARTHIKKKLVTSGYEYRQVASVPERYFFRKDYTYCGQVRRVHLHLVSYQGKDWQRLIGFRDFLRNNPQALKEYQTIKKQAVKKAKGQGEIYRQCKQSFIDNHSIK